MTLHSQTLGLELLLTIFERSEALRNDQRIVKYISLHEYIEDCCVSDSSKSDYSEDAHIRKTSPIIIMWKTFRGKTHSSECVCKTFGPSALPPEEFSMVKLTELYEMMQRCSAKTATTLLTFNTAREVYHGRRTVGGEKTNFFLFAAGTTI